MKAYLDCFQSDDFRVIPFFHTVRGQLKLDYFVVRFFVDMFAYLGSLIRHRPDGIHMLGLKNTAVPREFMVVLFARLFRIPVLYDIKGGSFIIWYEQAGRLPQWIMRFILNKSTVVLSEGRAYMPYVKDKFGIESHYFPNFVPSPEVPVDVPDRLQSTELKLLFVGYAYEGKGVFELIEGCNKTAETVPVTLTMIGREHEDFTTWLNALPLHTNLKIDRLGILPHPEVLKHFALNDLYLYPSRHYGEGHNNSINEAMMMGLVIVTTHQGFMDSILSEETAYFLSELSPQGIQDVLTQIHLDRETARQKAQNAHTYLQKHFTSDKLSKTVHQHYHTLTK